MSTFNTIKITLLLVFVSMISFAQQKEMNSNKTAFDNKVSELYTKYKTDGFVTYKGGNINMEKNTEFPIFVELKEGRWYQFVVIGDPEAKKLEMKLGLEGVGNIITDKFKTENTNEYWTQFSFVCPRDGKYLLTFYQKGSKKELLGHVGILQRPNKTAEGTYTFKH
ncbi:MAG: hypothetical protein IPL09_10970 [Bacteroidetes bacterium]|jgi:hypothetical protein|nr:hypothetical protein [Bacteroidota bacterium]MBK6819915.1 hypothetical protein [Bacteroidota bacterium]MBK7039883.1 hypothetical protein [Bacteroidota bacterium]MBK7589150.1 hypothetical protein [Bacteroidota bacterium]MBK8329967.1 hypothetical protein [Bacteroidota bacterium]